MQRRGSPSELIADLHLIVDRFAQVRSLTPPPPFGYVHRLYCLKLILAQPRRSFDTACSFHQSIIILISTTETDPNSIIIFGCVRNGIQKQNTGEMLEKNSTHRTPKLRFSSPKTFHSFRRPPTLQDVQNFDYAMAATTPMKRFRWCGTFHTFPSVRGI
jgi:hypothetical protein